jgi:hypothetical protein
MDASLDLRRLTDLRDLEGMTPAAWEQLVDEVGVSIRDCARRLESALAQGELANAVQATHRARNDAVMLGAGELNEALGVVERAARAGDLAGSRAHLDAVRVALAATLEALAAAIADR